MDAYQTVPVSSLTHSDDSNPSYLEPTVANAQPSSDNTLVEIERQDSPRLPIPDFSTDTEQRSRETTIDVDEWAARHPSVPPRASVERFPRRVDDTFRYVLDAIISNEDAVDSFVQSTQGNSTPSQIFGHLIGEIRDTHNRRESSRRNLELMRDTLGQATEALAQAAEQAALVDMQLSSLDQHYSRLVHLVADYAEVLHPDARARAAAIHDQYFGPTTYDYSYNASRSPTPDLPPHRIHRPADPRRSFRNFVPNTQTTAHATSSLPNGSLSSQKPLRFTPYHTQGSNPKFYNKKKNHQRRDTPHPTAGILPHSKGKLPVNVNSFISEAIHSAVKQVNREQGQGYGYGKARGACK